MKTGICESLMHDDFHCDCGGSIDSAGFDTCDEKGNRMEPDIGSGWDRTYICNDCGQVYRDTSEPAPVPVPELRETVHNWRDPGAEKRN